MFFITYFIGVKMNLKSVLKSFFLFMTLTLLMSCGSSLNYLKHFNKISTDLKTANYQGAIQKINLAKKEELYTKKDRVLYYLDKGIVLYYQGKFRESNKLLDKAERSMEELFTKSISSITASYLMNDNVIAYYGETYENIYVNIFKALNYLNLNQPEEALVEVKRINIKLRELDQKYGDMAREMNKKKKGPEVKVKSVGFYNDVLAQYLSYLIYRMQEEEDDSRISFEKIKEAWQTQSNIYNYRRPDYVREFVSGPKTTLNVIAFTGNAPKKVAVGGKITTYKNYLGISDLTQPIALPNVPFPGLKPGYHFKFEFPIIKKTPSSIKRIEVFIDGAKAGELQLLEDMGRVAEETFESRKTMIYIKTLIRTVTKGLIAAEAKKRLKKEMGANPLLGALMDAAVDAGVDATEKADIRCWRTMPENCYIGEFETSPGVHSVQVRFLTANGLLVNERTISNFEVKNTLNILDVFSLN